MPELTFKQVVWLEQHGGRGPRDVRADAKGLYVMMYHPKKENSRERIYLPKK